MMRILFLATRAAKASFRFRVQQVLPLFAQRGHGCDVTFLPARVWNRLLLYRQLADYDVVFIQKRLFSRSELFLIRQRSRRLVYDFDDAVMYNGGGDDDARRQRRFRAMAQAADLVVCGNACLASEASRFCRRLVVVPTAIDTDKFHPRLHPQKRSSSLTTVGWTGSTSTNRYLDSLFPVLAQLVGRIQLKFISDSPADLDLEQLGRVPYKFVRWSTDNEVAETATFDVGLMPLPDNRWTRGKCAFKALQYMALGIPAVCSPVGVNNEVIQHDLNGFLPDSREAWFQTIAKLAKNAELREAIGQAGRRRVEEAYSLNVQGPRLVHAVEEVLRTRARRSA